MRFWNSPGACSTCKHCSMDMELEPFCTNPAVTVYHRHGLNLNKAIAEFCGQDLKLREEREEIKKENQEA